LIACSLGLVLSCLLVACAFWGLGDYDQGGASSDSGARDGSLSESGATDGGAHSDAPVDAAPPDGGFSITVTPYVSLSYAVPPVSASVTITVVRAKNFTEDVAYEITAPSLDGGNFVTYLGTLPHDTIIDGVSMVSVPLTVMSPLPPDVLGNFAFEVHASATGAPNKQASFTVHFAGLLANYGSACTTACVDGGFPFTVPSNIPLLELEAWGAGGCSGTNGSGTNAAGGGGGGGFVEATIPVAPLESLVVQVGGRLGGGMFHGGCGGEGSGLIRGISTLVIAGGGGGGGESCDGVSGPGGGGGGKSGQSGGNGGTSTGTCGIGGGGATSTGNGASYGTAKSGGGLGGGGLYSGGIGGNGGACSCGGGGGGGGGNSGSAALDAGVTVLANVGASGATAGNATDSYCAGAGMGAPSNTGSGAGVAGAQGRVVLLVP
jgi:hypothetical protein